MADPATSAGLLAGLVAAGSLLTVLSRLNYDVGWLLIGARRLIAGGTLYGEDFVDVNPPLSVYALVPAAATSELLGISEIVSVRAQTLAVAAGVLLLARALLVRLFSADAPGRGRWWLAVIAFVALVSPAMHLGTEAVAFAQREHWIVLSLIPYLLLGALRDRRADVPLGLAVAVGLLLGFAVSMKPHYLTVPAAIELTLAARARSLRGVLRSEIVVGAAVALVYVAGVWLLVPGYLDLALPLALDTYWAYQADLGGLVAPASVAALALAAVARFLTPRADAGHAIATLSLAAAFAAYLAYALGGTPWAYHLLPFRGFVALGLAAPLVGRLPAATHGEPGLRAAARFVAVAAVAIVAVAASPSDAGRLLRAGGAPRANSLNTIVQDVIEAHGAGGPAVVLSTAVPPGFPAVNYAGVDWSLRHSCLWPLPAVIRARAGEDAPLHADRADEIERYVRRTLVADLRARPPDLIFVHTGPRKQALGPIRFDLLRFLLRDPELAQIFREYAPLRQLGPLAVYRRSDIAPH